MAFGFNTDVKLGDITYHVQTEPGSRLNQCVETTVFLSGSVQYLRRKELPPAERSHDLVGAHIREQHAAVISELKAGQLRGLGPALDIEWENACDRVTAGEMPLRIRICRDGRPACGCKLIVVFEPLVCGNGHAQPLQERPSLPENLMPRLMECFAGEDGCADMTVRVPSGIAEFVLIVHAELGLSVETARFFVGQNAARGAGVGRTN